MKDNNHLNKRSTSNKNGRSPADWQGDLPGALHSETVGDRGPVLEQDNILHETLENFIQEKYWRDLYM